MKVYYKSNSFERVSNDVISELMNKLSILPNTSDANWSGADSTAFQRVIDSYNENVINLCYELQRLKNQIHSCEFFYKELDKELARSILNLTMEG